MSEAKWKRCWPWSHKWIKWEVQEGTAYNRRSGVTRDAMVQTRRCYNCGFTQLEVVRGR